MKDDEFNKSEVFKEAFKVLSDEENEDRLFNTKYVTKEEAKELLANNKISGYFVIEEKPKVVVNTNGINETILKSVTEEIAQQEEIIKNTVEKNLNEYLQGTNTENIEDIYTVIQNEIQKIIEGSNANIEDISSKNLSYTMIEFYTLIAMTCLYGGILGMTAINQSLANMSDNGKRVAISPTSKGKLVLSSVMASYITQLIGITILFIYTIFVLKVDYGDNLRSCSFTYFSSDV